ncbi:MAG TPA: winged helix-turn-helix domain-containing protein [Nitrososphaerales archaeon]|nr:winged helix-turn-helix domain-containing protein [Nitrososphaerales archaeon]
MQDDPELRRLLWYLLGGARGGENRARIIHELHNRPCNLNQLALRLDLEYRSIQHHIEILRKNSMVVSQGERYGLTYFLTPWLESHYDIFNEISGKLHFKLGSTSSEETTASSTSSPTSSSEKTKEEEED